MSLSINRLRRSWHWPRSGRSSMLMRDYLAAWLDGKRSLRPSTRLAYRIHVNRYLCPYLGAVRLARLSERHLEAMYTALLAGGSDHPPVGSSTLTRIHATLRSALNSAVRRGLIVRNPADHIELPRPERPDVELWAPEELARFLEVAGEDDLYPLYVLLVLVGLRRGEVVGLRWCDVDLLQGCLQVRRQLVAVGPDVVAGSPKSRAGHRQVMLDEATVRMLECNRREQQRLHPVLHGGDADRPVFTDSLGKALDPGWLSCHFETLITEAGLPRIRLHDLRHTSATIGLNTGESLVEVSRRLGHSSIAVTADIYSHITPTLARDAAERRSRYIFDQ